MKNMPKIICTIGPASNKPDILAKFKERGVDFLRINLSHTNESEIEEKIISLKDCGVPIILDTEGAQIRTGESPETFIQAGQEIKIYSDKIQGDSSKIYMTPLGIIKNFKIGDLIEIDFNSALLSVADISKIDSEGCITCKCIIGGAIGSRKGVHLDSNIHLPAFSKKDIFAIELAKKYSINTFTLSFIRKPEDILEFKQLYPGAKFFSKIETKSAVENLDKILDLSDGILIDRGDLSREIPLEKIPLTQKYIISKAREKNKEVFVATNTLEKMAVFLKPDKSEANDIINTLLDGATGIALTKETAVGNYPVETVNTLITLIQQISYLPNFFLQSMVARNLSDTDYFSSGGEFLPKPHGGKLVNRVIENTINNLSSLKRLEVNENILMDLEQIAIGTFSPLEGFMTKKDFYSVLDNMRLDNGVIWTLPIILQVNEETSKKFLPKEDILLISEKDKEAYGILHLEEIYKINKDEVAEKLFGTKSLEHPGVFDLINSGDFVLGGKISLIKRKNSQYKLYELTPAQTRKIFSERGWKNVVGFHTRNVIHRSHEFIQLEAIKKGNCDGLFVHPVIGKKKEGDFETDLIVKSYEKMERDFYPKGKVVFSAFSTFSRYAGPREAVFTALVRKNFGCSHFIVGRDHTGVKNFYAPDASHKIFNRFSKEELGIIPIFFDKVFYSDIYKKHLHEPDTKNHPEDKKIHISGTQAREILQKGEQPPEWFMRPEISKIILDKIKKGEKAFVESLNKNGKVLWFTGLSGSGKTTIAELIQKKLEQLGKKVKIFDGDIVRKELHKHLGFTPEDIKENNRLISELCKKEIINSDYVLVPIISPFKESRKNARKIIGKNFYEIFVNCHLDECKKRDVKGWYSKVKNGEVNNFIGIHIPYEAPENPEIILNTSKESIEESVEKLLRKVL